MFNAVLRIKYFIVRTMFFSKIFSLLLTLTYKIVLARVYCFLYSLYTILIIIPFISRFKKEIVCSLSNKWSKFLYQYYLHHILHFFVPVFNPLLKYIVCINTKYAWKMNFEVLISYLREIVKRNLQQIVFLFLTLSVNWDFQGKVFWCYENSLDACIIEIALVQLWYRIFVQ